MPLLRITDESGLIDLNASEALTLTNLFVSAGVDLARATSLAEAIVDWRDGDELRRVQAALATLSDRARRIFVLRRVEGMPQKEIARTLGVSEAVVENEASRSLRAILTMLTEDGAAPVATRRSRHVRQR